MSRFAFLGQFNSSQQEPNCVVEIVTFVRNVTMDCYLFINGTFHI